MKRDKRSKTDAHAETGGSLKELAKKTIQRTQLNRPVNAAAEDD